MQGSKIRSTSIRSQSEKPTSKTEIKSSPLEIIPA